MTRDLSPSPGPLKANLDRVPATAHGVNFLAGRAEPTLCLNHRQACELAERGVRRELRIGQSPVPDRARRVPRVAPERDRGLGERTVGNPGVCVYVAAFDVAVHVWRLIIVLVR